MSAPAWFQPPPAVSGAPGLSWTAVSPGPRPDALLGKRTLGQAFDVDTLSTNDYWDQSNGRVDVAYTLTANFGLGTYGTRNREAVMAGTFNFVERNPRLDRDQQGLSHIRSVSALNHWLYTKPGRKAYGQDFDVQKLARAWVPFGFQHQHLRDDDRFRTRVANLTHRPAGRARVPDIWLALGRVARPGDRLWLLWVRYPVDPDREDRFTGLGPGGSGGGSGDMARSAGGSQTKFSAIDWSTADQAAFIVTPKRDIANLLAEYIVGLPTVSTSRELDEYLRDLATQVHGDDRAAGARRNVIAMLRQEVQDGRSLVELAQSWAKEADDEEADDEDAAAGAGATPPAEDEKGGGGPDEAWAKLYTAAYRTARPSGDYVRSSMPHFVGLRVVQELLPALKEEGGIKAMAVATAVLQLQVRGVRPLADVSDPAIAEDMANDARVFRSKVPILGWHKTAAEVFRAADLGEGPLATRRTLMKAMVDYATHPEMLKLILEAMGMGRDPEEPSDVAGRFQLPDVSVAVDDRRNEVEHYWRLEPYISHEPGPIESDLYDTAYGRGKAIYVGVVIGRYQDPNNAYRWQPMAQRVLFPEQPTSWRAEFVKLPEVEIQVRCGQ